MSAQSEKIANLNDLCRQGRLGVHKVTNGINALPMPDQAMIIQKVMSFKDFTPGNDPHGEHDFGSFEHNGKHINWKIDYYAPDMKGGSEDPADPEQTVRVLTIMLSEEY
jgi:hypothetical protein